MATWTLLKTSAILTNDLRHVCSSGTKIYYVDDSSDDIYEYDPDTNTETLIIDASAITDYTSTVSIAWFNNNLYILDTYFTAPNVEIRVERWDGTPDDLTTVKTLTLNGGPTQTGMLANASTIVAFTVDNPTSPDPYDAECWYSSDGSSWSAGSWDTAVWSPPDLNGNFIPPKNTAFPTGLFREFVTTTDAGRTTTTEKSIFQFIGGIWIKIVALNSSPVGIYKFSSPNESIHWTYTAGQYYGSDWSGPTTISSSPYQMYQVNMPYSTAVDFSSPTLQQLDGLAWTLLDTFTGSWDIDPTASPVIVRLDNGNVYIVAYASVGAGYDVRIFGRDEPIVTECAASFYYGIEVPTLAGPLPVCGVNPGAMLIDRRTGLVILGANQAGGASVIRASLPYSEWTDISGIVPTGTAVTSIKGL